MATLDARPGLVKLRIHRGNAFSLRCRFPNGYSAGKTFSATLDGAAITVSVDASDPDFDDITVSATGSQTANLDRLVEWKLTDTTSGSQDILVGPVEVTDGGTGSSSSSVNVTTDQVTVEVTTPASGGGAGVTDGDKGDIVVSDSGATWTIDAGAVSTAKIADAAVTAAKLGADVDAAAVGAAAAADLAAHETATTDVHGIPDTGALLDSSDVGVADGVAATDADGDVVRPSDGAKILPYQVGDLTLATGVYAGGAVEGGVIRQATSIIVPWSYTQTVEPTDSAIGTAFLVDWQATINSSGVVGPNAQTGHYGPRGVIEVEGIVKYARDMTPFGFSPISFGSTLLVQNTPAVARVLVPSWTYLAAEIRVADAATVTHQVNDVARGGAAFVDSQTFASVDGGTWDGETNDAEIISVLSMPWLLGNTSIHRRIAYDIHDINVSNGPTGVDATRAAVENITGKTVDAGEGTAVEQIGLRIPRLQHATTNIGVQNASATVEPPATVTLDAASDTLPVDTSLVALDNTTGAELTLTSTPTIPDGVDGQRLTVVNLSANDVILRDEAIATGSNLRLKAPTLRLRQRDVVNLRYSATAGAWLDEAPSLVGIKRRVFTSADATNPANTTTPTDIFADPYLVPAGVSFIEGTNSIRITNETGSAQDLTVEFTDAGTSRISRTFSIPSATSGGALITRFEVLPGAFDGVNAYWELYGGDGSELGRWRDGVLFSGLAVGNALNLRITLGVASADYRLVVSPATWSVIEAP